MDMTSVPFPYVTVPPATQLTVTEKSFIIYLIELTMLAGGLILCILFVIAVLRLRSFHQNVRILLINFAFSYIVEIFSRYMIIGPLLNVYLSTNMESSGSILWCRFAHGLNNTSDFVGSLDMIVLVLERIVATLKYRTYEEQRSPLIGICLIIVQWTAAFVMVWYNQVNNNTSSLDYIQIPCLKQYLNSSFQNTLYMLFIATDIIAITTFVLLLRINRRRYENATNNLYDDYLSKKFQTAENIRTTRLLWPLMVARFIVSCSSNAIIIIATIVFKSNIANGASIIDTVALVHLLGQSFDIVTAAYTVIFPQLAFYGHNGLFRELKKITYICKKPTRTHSDNARDVRDINGRQIAMMNPESEFNYHFASLQDQWNA